MNIRSSNEEAARAHFCAAVEKAKANHSQAQIARAAGMQPAQLTKMKSGEQPVTHKKLGKLRTANIQLRLGIEEDIRNAEDALTMIPRGNNASTFWQDTLGVRDLTLIDSSYVSFRQPTEIEVHIHDLVLQIQNRLQSREWKRRITVQTIQSYPLLYIQPNASPILKKDPLKVLASSSILCVGGPITNNYVRSYLNYVPFYPLIMGMAYPEELSPPYIYDRSTGKSYVTEYENPTDRESMRQKDYGIITLGRNPFNPKFALVAVMGLRAILTARLLEMLFEDRSIAEIANVLESAPITSEHWGHQILARYEGAENRLSLEPYLVPKHPQWQSLPFA